MEFAVPRHHHRSNQSPLLVSLVNLSFHAHRLVANTVGLSGHCLLVLLFCCWGGLCDLGLRVWYEHGFLLSIIRDIEVIDLSLHCLLVLVLCCQGGLSDLGSRVWYEHRFLW